jgi:hypothetical protein
MFAVCCPCCAKKNTSLADERKPLLINEVGPSGEPRKQTQVPTLRIVEQPTVVDPPPLLPPPRSLAPHELSAVRFEVVAFTKHGETLHISGDCAALGSYDPQQSVELYTSPERYPTWHTADGMSYKIRACCICI